GKSPGSWNTVATVRGSGPLTGLPAMTMRPLSGATRPPSMPSSVDLPQPDGPMIVQNSPSPTESETSRSASTAPDDVRKRRARPSIAISGGRVTSRQLEDLAGDDHALDLGGALADLGELGVAEDALDRELGDVAGAAVDLDGLGGGLHGGLGGEELGHGR